MVYAALSVFPLRQPTLNFRLLPDGRSVCFFCWQGRAAHGLSESRMPLDQAVGKLATVRGKENRLRRV
jgi:hypothetical protein